MGGGGAQESSTEPWDALRPYLKDYYQLASDAYYATPKDPYGGTLDAGPSDATLAAQQAQLGLASSLGGVGNNVTQLGQDTAAGKYLDINNNQYAQGAINAAIDPVRQQYQEQLIPQMQSAAISGGAYGGDREAILSAQAAENFARQAGNISGAMAGDFYSKERGYQQMAPQMIQSGIALNTMPMQLAGQVGQSQEFYNQNALNEAFRQYNAYQQAPWTGLNQFGNALNSGQGYGVTQTSGQDPWMGAAQGAAGGAMGGFAVGGPMGAAAGGIGGGLMGYFGNS